MPTKETESLVSPRINRLKQDLEVGNETALDEFWHEITEKGTPLIEPILGDSQYALVTFIWRGNQETKHVVLNTELLRSGWWNHWENAKFTRLLQTDLYYLTCRALLEARFVYRIAPNAPLVHVKDIPPSEYAAMLQLDPLNPHKFVQDLDRSLVEMPAAPPQPWWPPRPENPAGRVELRSWHSESLGNDRNIGVYTPPNYAPEGDPYPWLLLFDGEIYTTHISALTTLDNLIAAGRIPPLVVVLLDSPSREPELYCNEPFTDFLVQEIVPWVHQTYQVTTDPSQTIVGGMSAGGLAAAFTSFRYPEVFGNILSQSGAFGWFPEINPSAFWSYEIPPEEEWLTRQFARRERLPLRFYLDVGLLESKRDDATITLLCANRHLRDVLQAKGYWLHYAEFCGGHQYISWRGTLAEGLLALIGTA